MDQFAEQIVEATLAKTDSEADTTELFVRAAKLLKLTGFNNIQQLNPTTTMDGGNKTTQITGKLQPLVKGLMQTLLVDAPSLLCEEDKRNLMEAEYCKINLGIKIGNLALMRELKLGKSVSGNPRYYAQPYASITSALSGIRFTMYRTPAHCSVSFRISPASGMPTPT